MIQLSHCPETRHDGHDPVKGFAAPSAKAPVPPAQALPGSDHLKLHYDRRWGSWRSNAVGVVAVVWADMQVEMENGLGQLSSLIQEIRKRLCEAFGKDAVVGVVDDHFSELKRLFVCLLCHSEECIEQRKLWRPLELPGVKVTWCDTIDSGSRQHIPRLETCWNPDGLQIDGMSLELPNRWVVLETAGPNICRVGSHWYDFARIFGQVAEACLVPTKSDIVHLVVRYLDSGGRGAYSAFKALTGKALYNPLTSVHGKDMCVLHAVYGTYSSLLRTAARGILPSKRLEWSSQVVALPKKPAKFQVKGPIYELYPLKRSSVSPSELLRIAPWGPAKLRLGKHRKCHLCIQDESAAVSNAHAELCLMVPLDYDGVADATVRLMVSDSSKNGTWVNEQRLAKERFEELKDGHVLRIADVARYAVRRFNTMGECQRALPPEEAPEFRVPACPHFLRDSTARSLVGQGTAQVVNGHPEDVAEGERKRQRV